MTVALLYPPSKIEESENNTKRHGCKFERTRKKFPYPIRQDGKKKTAHTQDQRHAVFHLLKKSPSWEASVAPAFSQASLL